PLTAVHVPRDELGTEAVHMLQQRLVRPDATVGALLLYEKLVIRGITLRRIRPGKEPTPIKGDGLYD
ncbi:cytochrome-c peroxidase, partial (plasmid) [Escherichia coli]